MTQPTSRSCRDVLVTVLCVLLYAGAVAAYTVWSYREHRTTLMEQIDSRLLQAARSLKYLLAEDFHDRALGPDSISREEELRNRKLVTSFGVESGFAWVHTIAEADGRFYFSAPSVSEEEAQAQEKWYFHPYEDIPEEFIQAWRDRKPVYVNYTDQWGTFRSVALPQQSPGGRCYLASADLEISDIRAMVRQNLVRSVLVALFFLAASLPLILLVIHLFQAHTRTLRRLNAELQRQQDHLEELVQRRTADLEKETRRLQEALDNVRALRGLLPICAACRKIRDDDGYWDQLENYVLKHTDTEFSHGLCPDCLQRLYPEFASGDNPPPS
ncbi:MAG: hypothetical protein PHR34_00625 [Kiritimatiellae bacterium]|nr:hypothetical protein [Kiritimatiellia bacterium]